jgi:hypothetical protein
MSFNGWTDRLALSFFLVFGRFFVLAVLDTLRYRKDRPGYAFFSMKILFFGLFTIGRSC